MNAFVHLKSGALVLTAAQALAAPAFADEAGVVQSGFVLPPSLSFSLAYDHLNHLDPRDLPAPAALQATPPAVFFLAPDTAHAGISRELGGVRIKYGILATGLAHSMATRAFDPDALSPALMTVQPRINTRVLEFSRSFDRAALSFSLMRSKEVYPWPGIRRTVTAFGLGAPARSAQLTGVWLLAPKVALAAQASYGRTPAEGGSIRSNAFSIGVVASDRYRTGDRLSLALSQPIRVSAWVPAPGAAGDGRIVPAVAPGGRELLAEMNYVTPVGKTAYAGWAVSVRHHPGNVAGAPPEALVALRYVQQF